MQYKKAEEKIISDFENVVKNGEEKGYFSFTRDRAKITYSATGKTYNFTDPEEAIRAKTFVELIEKYGYPERRLDTEVYSPRREPKLPADIVFMKMITGSQCLLLLRQRRILLMQK